MTKGLFLSDAHTAIIETEDYLPLVSKYGSIIEVVEE